MSLPVYPHSNIFIGSTRTVDVTGPHIHVLDNLTGEILHSTKSFSQKDKDDVVSAGPVRCAAVDSKFKYLLTVGEDKRLKLWDVEPLKLINQRHLPKRPTALSFTADSQNLVVSDKFGDVFSYPFNYDPPPSETSFNDKGKDKGRDSISSHENPSGGTLILGHTSHLNNFLLTHDEKFIITADRDEHIRVSRFPKGYIIEMYCLGHLKFVSAIHIPPSSPSLLVSGGGDPVLKVWDWMTGKCKHELRIWDTVEPFLVVKGVKRRRGWWDGEGEEGDVGGEVDGDEDGAREPTEDAKAGKAKRGRRGTKNKGKGKAQEDGAESNEPPVREKVLVVFRIESIKSGLEEWIVFSTVGSTALFACPLGLHVAPTDIRHFDFGKPVLNFTVVDGDRTVVSLDALWSDPERTRETTSQDPEPLPTKTVRVVRLSSGEFSEDLECRKTLVDALNSKTLVQASTTDIKKLELYADLTSMPKFSIDPEPSTSSSSTLIPSSAAFADPSALLTSGSTPTAGSPTPTSTAAAIPVGAPELSTSTVAKKVKGRRKAKNGVEETELTKREVARLKVKEAVMKKAKEQAEANVGGAIGSAEETNEESDEPITKKLRSEDGLVDEVKDDDVVMADAQPLQENPW